MTIRPQLTALVVSSDKDVLGVVERALLAGGDSAVLVMDLSEAIAVASSRDAAIAFIDVTLAGTGGLALVHHLLAVRPDVSIYVMAPPDKLTHALEGLALGATGILPLPATGDSVMRAMGEVRSKKESASRVADLEHQLHLVRNTVRQMQRVAKLAAGAPRRELARASAEAIAESCGAMAVAVYFASEKQAGSFVRVADVGGSSLPAEATDSELDALAEKRERAVLPLRSEQKTLGRVVIEVDEGPRREIAADLVSFAASLLALAGTTPKPSGEMPRVIARPTSQVSSREEFDIALAAAIEDARARSGRVSVASIISAGAPFSANAEVLTHMFAAVRKKSDALARAGDEILLLLPDTGAVGAQLLRKRLDTVVAGVATFPQDGDRPEILLDRARLRRAGVVRSPIRDLDQRIGGLRPFIDALLQAPLVDSGVGSPYPLELASSAAASLVYYACVEARRGGMPWILVTEPSEKRPQSRAPNSSRAFSSFAAAAREACAAPGEPATIVQSRLRAEPGSEDVEAIVVLAEHGLWACCGVDDRDRFVAIHASDAALVDALARKVIEASR